MFNKGLHTQHSTFLQGAEPSFEVEEISNFKALKFNMNDKKPGADVKSCKKPCRFLHGAIHLEAVAMPTTRQGW